MADPDRGDEDHAAELERIVAGESLRLLAMFLMGVSVGVAAALLYVDIFQ